jgi:hypothetical protein
VPADGREVHAAAVPHQAGVTSRSEERWKALEAPCFIQASLIECVLDGVQGAELVVNQIKHLGLLHPRFTVSGNGVPCILPAAISSVAPGLNVIILPNVVNRLDMVSCDKNLGIYICEGDPSIAYEGAEIRRIESAEFAFNALVELPGALRHSGSGGVESIY